MALRRRKTKRKPAVTLCTLKQHSKTRTGRLPKTWLIGPHINGDRAMTTMYAALLTLMMLPVVSYDLATSGVAASTEVLEMGDSNAMNDKTNTMAVLRPCETRS